MNGDIIIPTNSKSEYQDVNESLPLSIQYCPNCKSNNITYQYKPNSMISIASMRLYCKACGETSIESHPMLEKFNDDWRNKISELEALKE